TNHAQTIVGYDDSISDDGDTGAFRVANSYGPEWGDSGYYWMTYECIKEIGSMLALTYIKDIPRYNPQMLAVWHFNTAPARRAPIRVGTGTYTAPVAEKTFNYSYDTTGPLHRFPQFMCMDITELKPSYIAGNWDFFLQLYMTAGSSAERGTFSSFKIELYNTQYVPGVASAISGQSPDVPAAAPGVVNLRFEPYTPASWVQALDAPSSLSFGWDGLSSWVAANTSLSNGNSCLVSGDVGDNYNSTLLLNVTGPGNISFSWSASCDQNDRLEFLIDWVVQETAVSYPQYSNSVFEIPSGLHTLAWRYVKGSTGSSGQDCGFLDNLSWSGGKSVLVVSPNGGEMWIKGTEHSIRWVSKGVDSLTLSLYKGTTAVATFAAGIPASSGTYTWNISPSLSDGTNYKIRISDSTNASLYDESDQYFTIYTPQYLNLINPVAGAVYYRNSTVTIRWNYTGVSTIAILLLKAGKPHTLLANSVSASLRSYNWYISSQLPYADDYSLKIYSTSNESVYAETAGYFTIDDDPAGRTLYITSPETNSVYASPGTLNITWSFSGNFQGVDIYLLKGDIQVKTIATIVPCTGDCTWSIPAGLASGTDYRIRINDHYGPAYAFSGYFILINPPGEVRNLNHTRLNETAVRLTWQQPLSDGGSAIKGYRVYRNVYRPDLASLELQAGSVCIAELQAGETTYTDRNVAGDVSIIWYISAVNAAGESSKGNGTVFIVDTASPQIRILYPAAGTIFNTSNVLLGWDASDDTGVSRVEIVCDESIIPVGLSTTYMLDLPDGQHLLTVKAYDSTGKTGESRISIIVDTIPPQVISYAPQTDSGEEALKGADPDKFPYIVFSEPVNPDDFRFTISGVSGKAVFSE
ncbi:MAG: Ser-Thr-rich GPI-anchored membrane family protein, partial [Thermoplasmata archaeon]